MKEDLKAAIVLVGDELLAGEVRDLNGSFLAASLSSMGFEVRRIVTVSDNLQDISSVLGDPGLDAEVVLVSGGLGPTDDDRTAEAAALAFGRPLQLRADWLEKMHAFLEGLGIEPAGVNKKQAIVPEGARLVDNERGTAPGFVVEHAGRTFYFLPGVPRELQHMFETRVATELARSAGRSFCTKFLDVFGMSEAEVAEALAPLEQEIEGICLGFLPEFPVIHVKVTAMSGQGEEPSDLLAAAEAGARRILGDRIYGENREHFAASLLKMLQERGETLAVAESCTGGRVGSLVTAVPGSSKVFLGSVVAYADSVKSDLLKVPGNVLESNGAVSAETAEAMARGVRRASSASWGLAVTGIAGPSGGTEDKPVGLVWFAMSGLRGTETYRKVFKGPRPWVQSLAAHYVLDRLRRKLLHEQQA